MRLFQAIPNSRLEVLENCSHMVMTEAADTLNKIIDDFIQTEILEAAEQNDPPDRKQAFASVRRRSLRPTSAGGTKSMPKLHLSLK